MEVVPRALLDAADHDIVYRVGGGVKVFSYGKPRSSIANTAQVLTEVFPYAPSGLSDVHVGTTAASDTNILRLTVETVADGVWAFGSMKNSLRCYVLACLTTGTTAGNGSSSRRRCRAISGMHENISEISVTTI